MSNNKGFTLTELIVAMTISAMLVIGVLYLVLVSIKGYDRISSTALLGNSTDSGVVYMEKILRSAKDFSLVTDDDNEKSYKCSVKVYDMRVKEEYQYVNYIGCYLTLNKNDKKIRITYEKDYDFIIFEPDYVLCSHVDDFSIVENEKTIDLDMDFSFRFSNNSVSKVVEKRGTAYGK